MVSVCFSRTLMNFDKRPSIPSYLGFTGKNSDPQDQGGPKILPMSNDSDMSSTLVGGLGHEFMKVPRRKGP